MKPTTNLEDALDAVSFDWLVANHPQLAEAVEAEVTRGQSPYQIRRRVMAHTQRIELAARCQQAARWLVGQGE